ncbi:flagellar hook-associated protein FlgK [Shewanella putrefaciens]|uniref:Flagellar hook-associated protein 1 n=1 Tax=Shewanella putrefaciens TaxID=24 RepID=A0ABX8X860_SHEPU|nr:flagellar hook-associated protein FlgK [Shewanella putrefaciens]AVV85980.1 flagellar hook protein FlgK [Shewanella putrefaciens]MCT8944998.1 flagellar hook-associated protein FlgK [Shewanella putrefaciens]QSE48282.1 flagellar hook-associated protein FlgK [Shewanella putrefaciens]QYX71687.1 flagellar hook-associated protein FlgK [Shewanella putrefaciens]GGN26853.1 flagellar hook-associated protein FlgK [Shewanella putrefaciens]
MAIDLLNIARTGVLASQSQLGVTSNNIANANTAGYHRQVATQSTLESQRFGNSFYGTGTYVDDVKRIYNDYAARELRIGQTTLSGAEASYGKLSELDQLFSQIGKMVPQSLNSLFTGLNSLADLPADLGIRSSTLNDAKQLANSLNQMQSSLNGQLTQTNDQITGMTKRINEISKELANLNLELMKSPNQDAILLDKQDALVQELSQYAQVNVIPQDNGAKSIMLGGSVMLVSGEIAMTMDTKTGNPFPNELQLMSSIGSQSVSADPSKLGGQLGALFEYRDQTLIPASHELDQLALGIADNFNKMQQQGLDLNGQVGANIFRDINDPLMSLGRVGGYSNNTGNATLGVNIDDTRLLTGGSYELSFTAPASYELRDTETGGITPLTLNGSTLEGGAGFSINIKAGAMASGDRFAIRPTAGAANGITVEMTDPKGIAAASPKITADAANSGNTQVKLTQITNRSAANFPITGSELTIQLDTTAIPPTYEAFDASGTSLGAAAPYTPPSISAFGFTFEVDSTAAASNDRFTFNLAFAEGDNSNAVAMAKLSESKVMNGGKSTLADVFENTKIDIGSKTKAAEVRVGSAEAIYQQAYARVESESGVNLDEEAANLMRFQQAYQASARIMTTAQQIFDTLLTSVR